MRNSIVRLKFNETQILQTQGSNICKLNYSAKSRGYNTPKLALGFIPVILHFRFRRNYDEKNILKVCGIVVICLLIGSCTTLIDRHFKVQLDSAFRQYHHRQTQGYGHCAP